jgi:hypothetical protein
VGVYDGSTVAIYVNGALETSTSFSGNILQAAGQPLCIGRYGTVGEAMNGLIGDVRVYNRALSVSEIQTLYNTLTLLPPTSFRIMN